MADRINSAKEQTANKTNLNGVPTDANQDLMVAPIKADTQQIDQAGTQVNQGQKDALDATNPGKINASTQGAKNIEYNKPLDSTYPTEPDPAKQVPTPQKKSFTEKLLEAQMANKLQDTTGRPTGAMQPDYPKGQGNDIDQSIPDNKIPNRPNTPAFNPRGPNAIDPQQPPGDALGTLPRDVLGNIPGATGGAALGPTYNPPKPTSMPKFSMPKFKL